ncbi:MAG: xanthine dehydrogenase accessory protein XdhC [Hydrogenophaga sp.]
MPNDLTIFFSQLALAPAILVTVTETQGSVPRERGAWMAVWSSTQVGTIGGGHLEWNALLQCRQRLALRPTQANDEWVQAVALGPSLGQCCGGRVQLRFEWVDACDEERLKMRLTESGSPVALFGSGHVGQAIARALAPLPFRLRCIDSRDEDLPWPADMASLVEHSEPVHAAVADLAPGSAVLIMSFSHAEDLEIVAACLQRLRRSDELAFVGLIGSRTKWATFRRRLLERGFTNLELGRVSCPIGIPGIKGKEPSVIAASVVAQLLLQHSGRRD